MTSGRQVTAIIMSLVILVMLKNLVIVPLLDFDPVALPGPTNSTVNNTTADTEVSLQFFGTDVFTNPLGLVLALSTVIIAAAVIATPKGLGSGADRGGVATTAFAGGTVILLGTLLLAVFDLFEAIPTVGLPLFALIAIYSFIITYNHAMGMLAGSGSG